MADPFSVSDVAAVAANAFGVSVDELTGPARTRPLVKYRQVAMAAARMLGFSLVNVAKAFGKRDHSTVLHAVSVVEADETLTQQAAAIASETRSLPRRLF